MQGVKTLQRAWWLNSTEEVPDKFLGILSHAETEFERANPNCSTHHDAATEVKFALRLSSLTFSKIISMYCCKVDCRYLLKKSMK